MLKAGQQLDDALSFSRFVNRESRGQFDNDAKGFKGPPTKPSLLPPKGGRAKGEVSASKRTHLGFDPKTGEVKRSKG